MNRQINNVSVNNSEINLATLIGLNPDFPYKDRFGGDYQDYDDYGHGNSFDPDNPYQLPDIIVTPGGNYWEDDNDDSWNSNPNDSESFDFDNYFHSGGENQSGKSDDQLIADGIKVAKIICDSIKNDTAIGIQKISETNEFKIANVSSFGINFAAAEFDVYESLMKDINTLTTFGRYLSRGNVIASGIMAYIAYSEDNNDCWAWASFLFGAAGALASFTPIGLPFILLCDGLSICCGAMSLKNMNNDNTSQNNQTYQ